MNIAQQKLPFIYDVSTNSFYSYCSKSCWENWTCSILLTATLQPIHSIAFFGYKILKKREASLFFFFFSPENDSKRNRYVGKYMEWTNSFRIMCYACYSILSNLCNKWFRFCFFVFLSMDLLFISFICLAKKTAWA